MRALDGALLVDRCTFHAVLRLITFFLSRLDKINYYIHIIYVLCTYSIVYLNLNRIYLIFELNLRVIKIEIAVCSFSAVAVIIKVEVILVVIVIVEFEIFIVEKITVCISWIEIASVGIACSHSASVS